MRGLPRRGAGKELVRFITAGSVDDGKSTLIGRLLYDSQTSTKTSVRRRHAKPPPRTSPAAIDFALLTDGLRAEREQGITIDVAYRYFSTTHRKFIIADTPGHEQYTRNMATGASHRRCRHHPDRRPQRHPRPSRAVTPTSPRCSASAHIVAAVNKMDLVDYSQSPSPRWSATCGSLRVKLGIERVCIVHPVSALARRQRRRSRRTTCRGMTGPTLLEYLETVPVGADAAGAPFRLPDPARHPP